MSTQELVIDVNGVSRATVLDLVETHGNVTYRYLSENDEEIEVSLTHCTDSEDVYEVEIDTGMSGSMMTLPDLSSAVDWFFELVEQNPALTESDDDEAASEDSDQDR